MRHVRTTLMLIPLCAGALAGAAPANAPGAATRRDAPPAWARDVVWYQVFPERFRNGDPSNDPRVEDTEGSWPRDPRGEWRLSPWTSDWYGLQPWEAQNGRGFYYNAQLRRYGGDLQGVLERLDYLKGLGINALYLNPVFESPSLHKYDATSHIHVDDNFGPDPAGDRRVVATEDPADPSTWKWTSADRLLLRLIAEAHRRGMRVVLDGVFNHVGVTHWAFRDVARNGRASPFADWFRVESFDDPATPENEFRYTGWTGVAELPELRDEGDTLAPGPREHVRRIVRRWGDPDGDGDPSDGVDGWRLDVAEMVGHGFWRDFRGWVREVNPGAYIVGEVWWQDWPNNRMFDAEPWLRGDQFDAVMNYRFAAAVKGFFLDRRSAIAASELDRRLAQVRADYRPEVAPVLMNLLDSHDTDRLASQAVNPDTLYDHRVSASESPDYDVRAPTAAEWRRVRQVVAFQFLYVGAPMVYYGSEAGLWGGDDPDERKPMVWPELTYEDEASHPFGKPRPRDPVRYDRELAGWYARLGRLRAELPALRRGSYRTLVADDGARTFVFERELDGTRLLAAFNASDEPRELSLAAPSATPRDLFGDRPLAVLNGQVRVRLEPWGSALVQ